jgi:hypothetical protein
MEVSNMRKFTRKKETAKFGKAASFTTSKKETVIPKIHMADKPKHGIPFRIKFIAIVILLVITLGFGIKALEFINGFFEGHRFVFHPVIEVKLSPPFTIEGRKILSPLPVEAEQKDATGGAEERQLETMENKRPEVALASSPDFKQLVAFVHFRESNNGTAPKGLHVTCREKGMSNEYGYAAGQGFCFADAATAYQKVYNWFNKNATELGIPQALCKYNNGQPLSDCEYYKDYLSFTLK